MKTLSCDLCDFEAQGETFEDWMNALKPHYAEAHADFMKSKAELGQAEMMAEMKKWMDENKARFEAA
ncbi:hypothetical protein KC722_02675 [Candidatus Kaiserbacteria bacterium]|nr:hypothetical protein [Candidatus Kaiserbacteria bacterium]